jgi:predicted dehydrogenase
MLKVGIIGLGKMGLSHCSIVNAHPNVSAVAVCDTSSFVLGAIKKHSKMEIFTDYKKLIDEFTPDAIFVSVPTKYHYEIVKYALEKDINVFCEKPFTLQICEAEELVALANRKRLVNQVGYHNRFIGTFMEVKRLLDNEILGELYHFHGEAYGPVVVKEKVGTWRSEKSEGGGCLYDYASHVINLLNYLVGSPEKVLGTLLKKIFSNSVEDAVYSALVTKTGLSGLLTVNWSDDSYRKMSTQVTINGKKGKIISDAHELKIYLKNDNEAEGLKKGWTIKYITDLTKPVNFNLRGEEYSSQIDYFFNAVQKSDIANVNSFESALQTDKVIEMLNSNAERM